MYTAFDPHFTAVVETGLAAAQSMTRGAIQDDDVALAGRRMR
jgi:hypothetical protein